MASLLISPVTTINDEVVTSVLHFNVGDHFLAPFVLLQFLFLLFVNSTKLNNECTPILTVH